MRRIRIVLGLGLLVLALGAATPALGHEHGHGSEETTQSGHGSDESRPLTPTYEAPPPEGPYTAEYMFAMTRGLADSTLHPAFKGPLFLFTVPLDIVLLPVTAIAGFF